MEAPVRTVSLGRSLAAVALASTVFPQASLRAAGPASLLWTGGSSNTWDTVAARWRLAAPNDTIWNNTTDAATIATFNTTGDIPISNAGITAGGLTFNAGSDQIVLDSPGVLTLTKGNITVAAGVNATINTQLATPAGLTLQGGGNLSLANDFSSNLTITAGILSSPSALNLGNATSNTVSLASAASAWNIAGLLDLGSSSGTASATLSAGALLHTDTLTLGASGGTGSVAVSGPGSTLAMDDIAYVGGDDTTAGNANITISGGAQVNSARTVIAGLVGSSASVTLTGANTTWAIGPAFGNALFVGSPGAQGQGGGGNGSLSILNGAHLTQDVSGSEPTIYISGSVAHPGAVTVSGTGSLLQAGSSINIGWTGPGHLDLSSGGAAVTGSATPIANTLVIDDFGGLTGAGTVNGNVVINGGFDPGTWALLYGISGEFASRTFTINGNYTQTSGGFFSAMIDGPTASTNTHLVVSGTATLAGSFFIQFPSTLSGNGTYSVINAGSFSGSFDSASAFGLTAPLYSDLSNLSINGTVNVIDPSMFWINPAGGSWQAGGNWSTGAAPTPLQASVFNSPGASIPVSFAADSSIFSAIFRNGNVSLALNGHSVIVTVPAPINNSTSPFVGIADVAGSSANVTLANGTLDVSSGNLTIGPVGNGSLALGDGTTLNAGNILLGDQAGGFGKLSIVANTTITNSDTMYVGNDGNGTVTQSGGSVTTPSLFIAYDPASNGNYTLTGGSLTVGFEIEADDDGAVSLFNQSGGTHTVGGELDLAGFDANSHATYNLSGTGVLSVAADMTIGVAGSASFSQTGGNATVGGSLFLTPAPAETALYSLQSGNLTTTTIAAGPGGTFTQTGGTLSVIGGLTVTGGAVSLGGNQTLYSFANLSITGGTLTLTGPVKTVVTSNYTMDGDTNAWNGLINLGAGKLLVSDPLTHNTTLADLRNQVASALTTGNGITSSALGAHMGLAVLDNAVLHETTFGGIAVDDSYVFVSPELLGDANADGRIDLTDLSTILNNFGAATLAWTSGNFDGAPTVDLTDLSDVLNNFGLTNPNASSFTFPITNASLPAAPTPEPGSLTCAIAATLLLSRRRPPRSGKMTQTSP